MRRFIVVFVLLALVASVDAQQTPTRNVRNAHEIYRELTVHPASVGKVKDYFPAFLEYQDLVMFHPKFGYYSSGRVSFTDDYQTFPIVLAPVFGNMIAEHVFHMWDGMRQSGTLDDKGTFTIGEFGAGNGALAESILEYIQAQALNDRRWAAFARQTVYVCYDRSPALNEIQKKRNARFGARFDGRVADATDLTATIKPGSLKGVMLSNELPDAFSVHKVRSHHHRCSSRGVRRAQLSRRIVATDSTTRSCDDGRRKSKPGTLQPRRPSSAARPRPRSI